MKFTYTPALCGASASQPRRAQAVWRSPSWSAAGQAAAKLRSKPTSRSPTAVTSGSARLTAPPMAQPLTCENGEVTEATWSRRASMTWSGRPGSRCERQ
jgi:hypothetical protein